ncbi:acyltransferase family protein [Anaeromyxobacter oryzae]|uniref:acyltransferase family protein n=1 Tax=Anaeromyxobacter oryzae TaxID=2918170 RepID=UPI0020BEFD55|nr:acyltransferase family protein [Anaeromyxobacter oryzae]
MSPPQPSSAAAVSSPGAISHLAAVDPPGPALARAPRIAALDAARALGVLAMVVGHTLDALLAADVRASPAVAAYWKARGLTAPLFLMVSGWAVTVAIGRGRAAGLAIPRGRLPRVLLLLAVGAALRWPGWDVPGLLARAPAPWTHLLAFDALHTIALSLLGAACLLALPWDRRERVLAFVLVAVLAVSLGMRAPAPLAPAPSAMHAPGLGLALQQAAGGTSPFPLFPWAAYFFAGGALALLAGGGGGRRAGAMAAVGAALVVATFWTGVGAMPPADPRLVLFRVGVILVLLAALSLVPAAAAARVAPLGRASLGVYALHLPVVYGWSTHAGLAGRIGPRLSFGHAVAVALAVLAASFAVHHGIVAARRGAGALLRRVRSPALAPPAGG